MKAAFKYQVLKPVYHPTGEFQIRSDKSGRSSKVEYFRIEWDVVGPADSMEDAKRRYGGHPILEKTSLWLN